MVATQEPKSFLEKAKEHWNAERLSKLTNGKKLLILPNEAPELLRALGILNKDASMSADAVRKFLQINHMLTLLQPIINDLAERFPTIGIVDLCCGKSYLSFVLAHYLKHRKTKDFFLLGIDSRADLVARSVSMANQLGLSEHMYFSAKQLQGDELKLSELVPNRENLPRVHLVVGLHACDVATDFVLATAIKSQCEAFAVAPCCQAELARKWSDADIDHSFPFYTIFKTPQLRREIASQHTDAMRFLLSRAHGYKVTATEFVPSEHTNKNRLILGERKGRYLDEAKKEYEVMCTTLANQRITLESLLI